MTDMKTILSIFLLVALTITAPLAFSQNAIDGFSAERALAQRRWEEQFRAIPTPQSAREHLRRLTLEPHIAGTKEDYDTAVYVRDQLRSYGLHGRLEGVRRLAQLSKHAERAGVDNDASTAIEYSRSNRAR